MNNFYIRLTQLAQIKGFKSINKFALNGLNYSSSEKLNRLKKEKTNPSVEILLDISNKFEDINIDWLLTGKGEMLKSTGLNAAAEQTENYIKAGPTLDIDLKDELIMMQKKEINRLEKEISRLEIELADCLEQKKHTKVIK
jgi:hypothetical protein